MENPKIQQQKAEKVSARPEPEVTEALIRIMDRDVKAGRKVVAGLMRIKGISWAMSNGIMISLKISPTKRIGELTKDEIKKIEEFIRNPKLPSFLLNRRKDVDSGEDLHLTGSDLDLRKEFDIKLLKKIRSYRGLRHALGLPTRGQKTRSHFRENKKSRLTVGVGGKKPAASGGK
ncbi:MAG: 30S ribosomal protein S13 [Nanoarchaeota archaeon]